MLKNLFVMLEGAKRGKKYENGIIFNSLLVEDKLRMFDHYSASMINCFNYCMRKGFLAYILHDPQIIFSYYRRGSLMHRLVLGDERLPTNFWQRLGDRKDVKLNKDGEIVSEKKYHNPASFVYYARRQWEWMIREYEESGRKITWKSESERYTIKNHYVPKICMPLFKLLVERKPPKFTELPFDFTLHGRRFVGRIDYVDNDNGYIVIEDLKTESSWGLREDSMKVTENPQMTVYGMAICAQIIKDRIFAEALGVESPQEFMQGAQYISPRIKPRFFMFEGLRALELYKKDLRRKPKNRKFKDEPQVIYPTSRDDLNVLGLEVFLRDLDEQTQRFLSGETKFIPAAAYGKKCDECDRKIACKKRYEEEIEAMQQEVPKDRDGQFGFSFVTPYTAKKPKMIRFSRKLKLRR